MPVTRKRTMTTSSVLRPDSKSTRAQAPRPKLRVAIAGMGAIGTALVRHLSSGAVPDVTLCGIGVRNRTKALAALKEMSIEVPVYAIDDLANIADVVVECLP